MRYFGVRLFEDWIGRARWRRRVVFFDETDGGEVGLEVRTGRLEALVGVDPRDQGCGRGVEVFGGDRRGRQDIEEVRAGHSRRDPHPHRQRIDDDRSVEIVR